MIPVPLAEVVALTSGRLTGVPEADAASVLVDGPVVTDSREAAPGGLYVARVGEHADGHDFAGAAIGAGCVAALTTRPLEGLPCVVVDDTQEAFAALARAVVDRSPHLAVVGITGSSGKTSTKDLLGTVLATAGPTVAPVGSYNSEVGVPLTVCRVAPDTRFLVVEMGARGVGHIAYLARMAPPRIGVVLNVGTAHVGEFGSREAIARAKSELPAAVPADGVAVLNADDPAVRAMAAVTDARVVLVGEAEDAEVRASDIALDAGGRASFTVHTPAGSADVTLGLVGRHHVGNALSVLAVALELGLALPDVVAALGAATPVSRWRMEVTERADGVTLVNDAYNANPDSMHAALEALRRMGEGRRTWAVLGTMLELGPESDALHAEVGADVVAHDVDELLVVGEAAVHLAEGASAAGGRTRVRTVADAAEAEALLRAELRAGDVALFKSSRDAGLRLLGDSLATPQEHHP
ncbi:UDP-N-acetylmuramoyl-tripeptide--D-alanyl-D-alanine ligase [Phycicoccus sp. MAQZ13P-2]|uniref:UDP-N-acetylmuramoyl-tripeptide--D-alanyl-D- alanine ligase n=1 Tax=Phycicoccus mangrovi TaxID=2840470 RepID=UPI001C002C9A|nr:UDP-N-acetylmuramoyl-tripeptide--D-alanyl-D-alanine ligase [Phycicoccus mangrovi]MBT9254829.1 UDP-N-acetylmuramoyl-tripeptide--D-alanyl-D-alanine ligase [Phycicoccus mangrovi]MBT9272966.1 UDP-N-acetylmuramoyl-tripeptide--D-alanyl-D-alanine ligase [Phycicoccus mangrovi]